MELVESYPDKPWNWYWISKNLNITMEMIESHPDKPWDWECISENPNITMEMIEAHPDKPWNWERISSNMFGWTSKETPLQYYKKRKAQTQQQTEKIKEELIAYAWHPDRVMDWCFDVEELREINDTFC
jgi:hypothetical protein